MRALSVWILLICIAVSSAAQTASTPTWSTWLRGKIISTIEPDQQVVGKNGTGSDRQKESPSTDPRSTSLVDQSSATDFISVAASVVPVTPGLSEFISNTGSPSSSNGAGSTTATASLYALLAALNKVGPTDPQFYKQHVFSRRVSFTVGTAASTQATDGTDTPAVVYGTKWLLINGREIYSGNNQKLLDDVAGSALRIARNLPDLEDRVQKQFFIAIHPDKLKADGSLDITNPDYVNFMATAFSDVNFAATLASLPASTMPKIDNLIKEDVAIFRDTKDKLENTYDQISKGRQLSISYTANIRDSKGNNDHRVELIFDYGLSPRINWTVNASGDYTDRKSTTDSKGGRFATSFQGDLTKSNSSWGKTPIRLTFSGEAKWLTSQKPQYTFQSELIIPLSPGVDLPIVYRYANRIALINQTDSEARLGLSVDVSRLAQAFKQQPYVPGNR